MVATKTTTTTTNTTTTEDEAATAHSAEAEVCFANPASGSTDAIELDALN